MSQGQRPALQTRSRETRDKLVAALETCLQSKRFDAISVADIAREAGLAVGTVYRRFENKDAFIPVLFELFRIRLNESYGDAGGLEIDPEQGLKPALHTITTTSWSFLIAQQHLARETLLYARLRPDLVGKEWDDLLAVGQASFVSLARRHDVAMVLAGHNHSYTRASFGTGMTARTLLGEARDVEMVIAVSVSGGMTGRGTGPAYMESNQALADELTVDRWGNNTPTFQSIRIDGDQLVYTAYTALGQAYDAFTLTRDADGNLRLVDGEAAFGDIRQLETTEPYAGNDHLR